MVVHLRRILVVSLLIGATLSVGSTQAAADPRQTPVVSPTYPTRSPNPNPPPPSDSLRDGIRIVDLNGHAVRVRIGGLQHVAAPAVILEAGGTDDLESWNAIFADVTTFARAVAYDRPGNGESAPDGQAPTPAHIAETLHALLQVLRVPPPYVLVGHSWGGPLIRMFVGM
jgi:pimeloyl-ACP methyl ester carboxylesterase